MVASREARNLGIESNFMRLVIVSPWVSSQSPGHMTGMGAGAGEWHMQLPRMDPRLDTDTPTLVRRLLAEGFVVRAWGAADDALMRQVVEAGGDGMTVNFPDKLLAYLKSTSHYRMISGMCRPPSEDRLAVPDLSRRRRHPNMRHLHEKPLGEVPPLDARFRLHGPFQRFTRAGWELALQTSQHRSRMMGHAMARCDDADSGPNAGGGTRRCEAAS